MTNSVAPNSPAAASTTKNTGVSSPARRRSSAWRRKSDADIGWRRRSTTGGRRLTQVSEAKSRGDSCVDDEDDYMRSEASVFASFLNLANNVVGAGLFSLCWCLKESTLVTGMIVMLGVGVLNGIAFVLLAQCCEMAETCSYLRMMQAAFGTTGGLLAQCTVLLYACGSCISFVVLAGDFLLGDGTGLLDEWGMTGAYVNRATVMTVVAVFVFLPLSLLRNLEPLKYTSFLAFLATMYSAVLVAYGVSYRGHDMYTDQKFNLTANPDAQHEWEQGRLDSVNYIGFPPGVFAALPLINVAFTAHYNGPRYYAELEDRSVSRWTQVIMLTFGFIFVMYTIIAICGYLIFGDATTGDLLMDFSADWGPAIAARLALAVLVICVFPMTCHSIRDSLIDIYYRGEYTTDSCPTPQYVALTVFIITISTIVGVTCTKVEDVLAYKGALFGSMMVYIFPPLVYMILKRNRDLQITADAAARRYGDHPVMSETTLLVERAESRSEVVDDPLRGCSLLRSLFCNIGNARFTFFVVWGVVTGTLGVVITVMKQAGAISA
eukprot:TRINITY_DN12316_c0_g1_i1.p1 TRINITY_DN12316_c0_g1~~TRINITY_DN12316_c0_g1_i1.p1  ORF type:complete len:549 (+),score=151.09 TRINITY_DN12316_c0_g1_i1:76-1722(+)